MIVESGAARKGLIRGVIIFVAVVVFTALCYYDGWISDKFKDDPSNLLFNRIASIVLTPVAIFIFYRVYRLKNLRVVANEEGIDAGNIKIGWGNIEKIDCKNLDRGLVDIYYKDSDRRRKWVVDSYKIDKFDELIECIAYYRPDLMPVEEGEREEQ